MQTAPYARIRPLIAVAAAITLSCMTLCACSRFGEFSDAADLFVSVPSERNALLVTEKAKAYAATASEADLLRVREQSSAIMKIMYDKNYFLALNRLMDAIGPSQELEILMAKRNFGDTSSHRFHAAVGLLRTGKYYDGYTILAALATTPTEPFADKSAATVLGILTHFGCSNDAAIWAELSKTPQYPVTFRGSQYTKQPKTSTPAQEGVGRKQLSDGKVRDLDSQCPVLLYKSSG